MRPIPTFTTATTRPLPWRLGELVQELPPAKGTPAALGSAAAAAAAAAQGIDNRDAAEVPDVTDTASVDAAITPTEFVESRDELDGAASEAM